MYSEYDSSTLKGTINTSINNDYEDKLIHHYNETEFEEVEDNYFYSQSDQWRRADNTGTNSYNTLNKQSLIESGSIEKNGTLNSEKNNNETMFENTKYTGLNINSNSLIENSQDNAIKQNYSKNLYISTTSSIQPTSNMFYGEGNQYKNNINSKLDIDFYGTQNKSKIYDTKQQNNQIELGDKHVDISNLENISNTTNQNNAFDNIENNKIEVNNQDVFVNEGESYLKLKRSICKVEKFKLGISIEIFKNIISLYRKFESDANVKI